ncbi:transient receptor potential cation channel subfamily M member 2-like [Saccostrea cucullata]|uniref:transient receptor potential cation channel subfamily M member 2-like n=1 Tax=Saccostrea cuccullata TaxID=36930 RepID=UPI002ED23228
MSSYAINEVKQLCIAIRRKCFRLYIMDFWNVWDWLALLFYVIGMLVKMEKGTGWTFKMILITTFNILSIRIIPLICISEILGPKLVTIKGMLKDTIGFMAIMAVIMTCYNVTYYTMLYSNNAEFSYDTVKTVMFNGYWILFGELDLERDNLKEPECSFSKEDYINGKAERCPSTIGRLLGPYFKALYAFVAVIMMLNILIATYNNRITAIHARATFHWSRLKYRFLEEYSLQSIFPFHMQGLAMLACLFHFLFWKCRGACKQKETNPKFIRVFWYDTDFDVELKETKIKEDLAALGENMDVGFEEWFKLKTPEEEIKELKQCIIENNRKMEEKFQTIIKEIRERCN